MKFKSKNKFFIIEPVSSEISQNSVKKLEKMISGVKKKIAIDLKNVSSACNEFFDFIKIISFSKNISFINISPELCFLFFITKTSQNVELYNNEIDLIECKRSIVNRNFYICT